MSLERTQRKPSDKYAAYLVRLWQDSDQAPWRASAQSAQSGEVVMFACLADLFEFLEAQTALRPDGAAEQWPGQSLAGP